MITEGEHNCVTLKEFIWVNTVIGNVKTAMTEADHLPRNLAKFCYRFNRRFQLDDMLSRLDHIAIRTLPMPEHLLKLTEGYG